MDSLGSACTRAKAYIKVKEFGHSDDAEKLAYPDSPIVKDLGNGLCVTYVFDEGEQLRYIQNRHRQQAGLPDSEIHLASIENLAELARQRIKIVKHGSFYAVLLDGNFEASLILVDGLWDRALAHLAPNGFVAAIPARDILAFCDANSAEGVAELKQLIERIKNADHMLSRALYQRGNEGWQPLSQTLRPHSNHG